jgi:hypothetical protein
MRAPAELPAPIAPAPPGELAPRSDVEAHETAAVASCDYCGSARLEWRKCKLICADCKQINKSCADL